MINSKRFIASCKSIILCLFPETRCGVETTGGNGENLCCVFPFNYRGIDYFTCTTADSEEPWCSITRNYDRDGLWGNCVGESLNFKAKQIGFDTKKFK